jgi:hypothetical protein
VPSQEHVMDETTVDWTVLERETPGFALKRLGDGLDGRPYATIAVQPEGYENPAHFHGEAQFEVLLEGSVDFPQHPLKRIAIHYSDANSPYGPFLIGHDFKHVVVRKRATDQVYMSDREGRKRRNPYGRELFAQVQDHLWESYEGTQGTLRQALIDSSDRTSPFAQIFRCDAHAKLAFAPPTHGAFHIVVAGSVELGGEVLALHSMRYVQGDEAPTPLVAGEQGASIVEVGFGEDLEAVPPRA